MSEESTPSPTSSSGQSRGDIAHNTARALLSAIPSVGGPSAVLFESIFRRPIDRRRDATLSLLESAVAELRSRPDADFDALRDRDDFCEFAHDVLRAAARAHREEKLDALRNALVNMALFTQAADTKSRVNKRLIDELDVHHLLMLKLMASPATFLAQRGKQLPGPGDRMIEMDAQTLHESPRSLKSVVRAELGATISDDLVDIVLQDLVRRGLTSTNNLSELCTHDRSFASPLGHKFIRFIGPPESPAS